MINPTIHSSHLDKPNRLNPIPHYNKYVYYPFQMYPSLHNICCQINPLPRTLIIHSTIYYSPLHNVQYLMSDKSSPLIIPRTLIIQFTIYSFLFRAHEVADKFCSSSKPRRLIIPKHQKTILLFKISFIFL